MAASSDNAKAWELELSKTLNRDSEYILLTSIQLVRRAFFSCFAFLRRIELLSPKQLSDLEFLISHDVPVWASEHSLL